MDAFLGNMKEVMSDKTLLYIEVPGILTLPGSMDYHFDYLHYLTHAHINHYSLQTLKYHVSPNGYRMIAGDETVYGIFALGEEIVLKTNLAALEILFYLNNVENNYANNQKLRQKMSSLRKDSEEDKSTINMLKKSYFELVQLTKQLTQT